MSSSTICAACHHGTQLGFGLSMAFQPTVDTRTRSLFAYEALVRGLDGSGAAGILARSTPTTRIASIKPAGSRR